MPTSDNQRILMDNYVTYRTEVLLNGESQKSLDWVVETTHIPVKAKPINSSPKQLTATSSKAQVTAVAKMEPHPSNEQNVGNIREAAREIAVLDRQLQLCSRMEFLKPNLPITPKALLVLREELDLLKHSLAESMEKKPLDPSVEWSSAVQQQCHDLKDLEKRIGVAMSAYEEAQAMNNYYNYNSLDVLGNKHKNLVKQAHITQALGVEGIEVPMPQGIESHKIKAFLKNYAPEVFEHWEQIRTISKAKGKNGILDNEEVVFHLKEIDEGIAAAFLKAATDDKTFTNLGISQKMKDWLVELSKAGKHLMVRSTGAEDSKKSANAGGNASIAYVKPNQEELSKALGEVVRSYFSFGSLQKRLNANLDPFEDELRVAVTTQELIGEPLDGAKDPAEIPVSLVLFTSEPLFIGEEKFRAMRISATHGHGEGIVGNRGIASDTALVLISASDPSKLYILYDNQEKSERLAPVRDPATGKITLEKIANSAEMAKNPALNDDLISRLYTWGVIGEKFFEDFTDMEIVVKGGTIYPVQGRPINRGKLFGTYLDHKKIGDVKAIKEMLRTEMIVPGKASVVEITKPEEILIVQTLEKAEGLFQKGLHKLVVVGQEEPANSHPVVNFSALGIPCLFAKDLPKILDMAKQVNPSTHLAVCVQAGTFSFWDTSKGRVEEFTTEGFVVHPAKIAVSLPFKDPLPQKAGLVADIPENVKDTLYYLRTATNNKDALLHFDALKNIPWIKSLDAKSDELEDKVAKQPLFEHAVRPTIEMAKSLRKKLEDSFLEVETLLSQPGDLGRLEFLIHVKVLETLLFQRPVSSGAISQKSLLTMQESFAAADARMVYQSQLEHPAHFIDLLMDGAESPVEAVYDDWSKFLLTLEPIAEAVSKGKNAELTQTEISHFKTVLHTLRQGGVLPIYMTFMLELRNSGIIYRILAFLGGADLKSPAEIVRFIIASLPLSEEPIIEQIFFQRKDIRQLKNDIAQIANPKTYAEMLSKLEKALEDFLPQNQGWLKKEQWEKVSPVTRSFALQTMNELVDLYDTAVKVMKASSEIGDDIEKTKKFKEMLSPYLKLLKAWTQNIIGAENYHKKTVWEKYDRTLLEVYFAEIENIFNDLSETDPENLRPSFQFSVNAALLGVRPLFEIHYPLTMEDVFTLTHQNLLASSAFLTKKLFSDSQINSSPLPQLLKSAIQSISTIKWKIEGTLQEVSIPQQTGFEVDQTKISFYYNVPLRAHSAKFSIHYDRMTKMISFEGQFLGLSFGRWQKTRERLEILNFANILNLQSEVKLSIDELSFNWNIETQEQLEKALREFRMQVENSFVENDALLNQDVDNFITEVTQVKTLQALAISLLNENKNKLNDYGKKAINRYLENIQNFNTFSKYAFVKLFELEHPLANLQEQLVISYLKGKDISEIIKGKSEQEKNFLEHAIISLQNDPQLIYQIPINALTGNIWRMLLSQSKGISEFLTAVKKEFINIQNKDIVFQLLETIVSAGHGISEVLSIAQQTMDLERGLLETLDKNLLYNSLIEIAKQGKEIPKIISIAQRGVKDTSMSVRQSAFGILSEIVKHRKEIPKIIQIIKQELQNQYVGNKENAFFLLMEILKQGQGVSEAISFVQLTMQTQQDSSSWDLIFKLLILIAKQGQGKEEILAIAQHILQTKDMRNKYSTISMLTEIAKEGQWIPEIMPLTRQAFQDKDSNIQYKAIFLLTEIAKHGQEISNIIPLIQQALQDPSVVIKYQTIQVLIEIAKQGQGISEITPLAQQALQDQNPMIREEASRLQQILNDF